MSNVPRMAGLICVFLLALFLPLALGSPTEVPIQDEELPELEFQLPDAPTTGQTVHLEANVTDNVTVAEVRVTVWYGDDWEGRSNLSMEAEDVDATGNGTYALDHPVPDVFHDSISLFFEAVDGTGNWNRTEDQTLPLGDGVPPLIVEDRTPSGGTTGDVLHFEVEVMDTRGVSAVELVYWFTEGGESGATTVPMAASAVDAGGNGTYNHTGLAMPPDSLESLFYRFRAYDASMNSNATDAREVPVADDDPPVIEENLSDLAGTTGEEVSIQVRVSDNIGVANVTLEHWFRDRPEEAITVEMELLGSEGGSRTYGHQGIKMRQGSLTPLEYRFIVVDTSNNTLEGEVAQVGALDDDPPVIVMDMSDPEAVKGLWVRLDIDVTDNIGVTGTFVVWWFGDGETTNSTFNHGYGHVVEVPRQTVDALSYQFKARDGAGNWVEGEVHTLAPVNHPPDYHGEAVWTVTEGQLATLNLTQHLFDDNDDVADITVTVSDTNITVDGQNISVLHDIKVPDYPLLVLFSDGENTTEFPLMVHVINVNDVPVVTVIRPDSGSTYKEGEAIEFHAEATDEDGGELSYIWSVEGRVIGRGADLSYAELGPGTHTVKLVVDDGHVPATETITVTVESEEEEEDEGPGIVWYISIGVLIVVAVALLARRR